MELEFCSRAARMEESSLSFVFSFAKKTRYALDKDGLEVTVAKGYPIHILLDKF